MLENLQVPLDSLRVSLNKISNFKVTILSFILILVMRIIESFSNPTYQSVKDVIKFCLLGWSQDLLILSLLFLLIQMKVKTNMIIYIIFGYFQILLYTFVLNIICFYHTGQSFSYEMFLAIKPAFIMGVFSYINYLLIFFLFLFILIIVKIFWLKSLKGEIPLCNRVLGLIAYSLLLVVSLIAFVYYQNNKNSAPFYKGYFLQEFRARPVIDRWMDFWQKSKKYAKLIDKEMAVVKQKELKKLQSKGLSLRDEGKLKLEFSKIVLIPIESLDRDYLRSYNESIPKGITTNLDYYVKNYVSFSNFYTADSPTMQGLYSLLSSRLDYNLINKRGIVPNLVTELQNNNFLTFMIAGSQGYYGQKEITFKQLYGFDDTFFGEKLSRAQGQRLDGWGINLEGVLNHTFEMLLKNADKKAFFLVENIDTHSPYKDRGKLDATRLKSVEPKFKSNNFLMTLLYIDVTLHSFIQRVFAEEKLGSDTLIVITSDHSATHGANFTNRQKYTPDRIPLIFISKDNILKGVLPTDKYCSQIDFAPTLLSLFDIEAPMTFSGSDFRSSLNEAIVSLKEKHLFKVYSSSGCLDLNINEEHKFRDWFQVYYPGFFE